MGIRELIGMEADRKVRYAVVGLGDIAQEDMMPGFDHTGNSEITEFVTSDAVKADELDKKYGVEAVFSYEQFSEALASGTFEAIYLATPNWRHAEFIIPALKAGIHVLTEKPLEISTTNVGRSLLQKQNLQPNSWSPIDCTLSLQPSTRLSRFDPGNLVKSICSHRPFLS